MESLVRCFMGWSTAVRLLIKSIATAAPFYFGAFLSLWLAKLAETSGKLTFGLHMAVFIVLLTFVVFVHRYLKHISDRLFRKREKQVELKLSAYTYLDRILTESIRRIGNGFDPDQWQQQCGITISELQHIVDAAYSAFEAAYGTAVDVNDRIDFEVTFMTMSYIDGHITIPASANRDGRHPRSMVLRHDNPNIYDNTVTAEVYGEVRPKPHIISDTHDRQSGYAELYAGQANRIRSSIVFPVLSDTNELLGTLVVHCNNSGFFAEIDARYWTDLLEIFAKRIAVVKKRLDLLEDFGTAFNAEIRLSVF